ncbi:hypothetical protein Q3C01_38175 [Bradyrhizobium sp. UFLA05-109]
MTGRNWLWALLVLAALGALASVWQVIWGRSAPATKIAVLDGQSRIVREITSDRELAMFDDLWSRRVDAGAGAIMRHSYKLQIVRNGRSTSWLYDPAGLTQVLAVHKRSVYLLPSADELNTLLDIAAR